MQTYIYKSARGCDLHADVYQPVTDSGPHPVIIWIHGGALILGSRKMLRDEQLNRYLENGFVVVAVDYRLAPETRLEDLLTDIHDAYAWIRDNGPRFFGADPSRVALIGHSAGGYLALMGGVELVPRVNGVVSLYGYGDIIGDWYSTPNTFYRQEPIVSRENAYSLISDVPLSASDTARRPFYLYCRQHGVWPDEVTGYDLKNDAAAFDRFCPIRHVTSAYPPTLLLHGDCDTDVPYQQSVDLAAELSRHGVEHELITIGDGDHVFDADMSQPQVRHAIDSVMVFLDKHLSI